MKRVLFGVISICMLLSCSSHGDKKVNVAYKYASMKDGILHLDLDKSRKDSAQINISDLCDEIIYIPLETNNKCLISDSESRKYLIDGGDLFIRDNGNLYHFNTKGEFLGQFGKKGRGANEFVCGEICIDRDNKQLYAKAFSKNRLLEFDYNGKLLSEDIKCDLRSLMYESSSKSFLGTKHYALVKDDKYEYNILMEQNKKGKVFNKLKSKYFPDHFFKDVENTGLFLLGSTIYKYNDEVYFQELASDTVFMRGNAGLKAHVILNNNDFRPAFTSNEIGASKYPGVTIYCDSYFFSENSRVTGETDRFIFIGGCFNSYVYDKNKRVLSMAKSFDGDENTSSYFFYNDMDNLAHISEPYLINNEYLVTSIQAVDLLDYLDESKDSDSKYYKRLAEIAKGMTEESNPVIMLARLKK